jgi:Fe2+ or Zn2+ uptake regulation protein
MSSAENECEKAFLQMIEKRENISNIVKDVKAPTVVIEDVNQTESVKAVSAEKTDFGGFGNTAKVEAVVMTITRSIPQFSVIDIMKALGQKPPNSSNPTYLAIYNSLDNLMKRGVVDKYSVVQDGRKFTYYCVHGKPKPLETSVEEDEMPVDTNDDCLRHIVEHNCVSFGQDALCKERNIHGAYYDKYSAKALFEWMFRHTDEVSRIVGKVIESMGSGDYRYIKVRG